MTLISTGLTWNEYSDSIEQRSSGKVFAAVVELWHEFVFHWCERLVNQHRFHNKSEHTFACWCNIFHNAKRRVTGKWVPLACTCTSGLSWRGTSWPRRWARGSRRTRGPWARSPGSPPRSPPPGPRGAARRLAAATEVPAGSASPSGEPPHNIQHWWKVELIKSTRSQCSAFFRPAKITINFGVSSQIFHGSDFFHTVNMHPLGHFLLLFRGWKNPSWKKYVQKRSWVGFTQYIVSLLWGYIKFKFSLTVFSQFEGVKI